MVEEETVQENEEEFTLEEGDIVSIGESEEITLISKINTKGKWWRVKSSEDGEIQPRNMEDVSKVKVIGKSKEEPILATNVPRYRHKERRCILAKEEELKKFDDFKVFEEVPDNGQFRLGTNWVITEKEKEGMVVVKARLTIRGDQEDVGGVRTDSPTIKKGNIRILLTVAAKEKWKLKSSDVTSAFLQSVPLNREVFVRPPLERRIPGILWRLNKPVYGLADASRGFHLSLCKEIISLGCESNNLEPAMYALFKNGTKVDDYEKKPLGVAVSHVDDIMHAGEEVFDQEIMCPLKGIFKFGSQEEDMFRYVGWNIIQKNDHFRVDQEHYLQSLESPDLDLVKNLRDNQVLCEEGQHEFRSYAAKLAMIGYQSRPDVCFEAKVMSTKYGKATKHDLKVLAKKILKVKAGALEMRFPDLGEVRDWAIVAHGDAGIKSMPDKINSVAGTVVLLVNKVTNKATVPLWKSKKIKRKVASSLAGETLAMTMTIGEVVYMRAVLCYLFGKRMEDIPAIVFTDSNNLFKSVHSSSQVEDTWLIPDVAMIKDALEQKVISEVRLVPGERMLANCLTKAGVTGTELLEVLRTGEYEVPGGWIQ